MKMHLQKVWRRLFENKPIDIKKLAVVYLAFIAFAAVFEFSLEHLPLELYRIKELAAADVDFTDIYYQLHDCLKKKDVVIINSGSLGEQNKLRAELSRTITLIAACKPRKIGLDYYFADIKNADTARILEQSIKLNHVVFGIGRQYQTIFKNLPNNQIGYIQLPNRENESVREYYNYNKLPVPGTVDEVTVNSFAKALVSNEITADAEPTFFLKYSCNDKGYYNAMQRNTSREEQQNFPAFEASDIINGKVPEAYLKEMLANKIVIIGIIGKGAMENTDSRKDKHRTPVDFELLNRQPLMAGVIIHANAVQMMVDGVRVNDVDGFWYYFVIGILVFFYLYCLMLIERIKPILLQLIVEIVFLIFSVLALIRLSIALLYLNVHFRLGLLLAALFLLIEFKIFAFRFYEHLEKRQHSKKHKKEKPNIIIEENIAININIE